MQAEGDQALRRGELRLAAEGYGGSREALSVLNRERSLAVTERTRAAGDLQRAQSDGDDIAWAAAKVPEGNHTFATGGYITSDIDYTETRTNLIEG